MSTQNSKFQIPELALPEDVLQYTPAQVMEMYQLSRTAYYEITRADSRGIVMLEYGRRKAGGRRVHTLRQLREYNQRVEQLGSARKTGKSSQSNVREFSSASPLGEGYADSPRGEDAASKTRAA